MGQKYFSLMFLCRHSRVLFKGLTQRVCGTPDCQLNSAELSLFTADQNAALFVRFHLDLFITFRMKQHVIYQSPN